MKTGIDHLALGTYLVSKPCPSPESEAATDHNMGGFCLTVPAKRVLAFFRLIQNTVARAS